MSQDKRQKTFYLLGAVLLFAGLGYLLFSGFSQNRIYFLTVGEALNKGLENMGQARLFGVVSNTGLVYDAKHSVLEFHLADKDDSSKLIVVRYQGPVPDTFKPGVEVIIEGQPQGKDFFEAKTLMTKCPSKYKKTS